MIEKIGDAEIYYEIAGEGIPIVMLHGWGMDRRLMSGCLEELFKGELSGFKRIYLDLPGMGKSKAGSVSRADDAVRVLIEFINRVVPSERFILAGESFGGYLSRAIVRAVPERVRGLLLICAAMLPGYRRGTVEKLKVEERDEKLLSSLTDEERTAFEYMNVVLTREVWEAYKRDIIPALAEQNKEFLGHIFKGELSYDVDAAGFSYDGPCLILTARGDTEVGYKDHLRLLDIYPRASYMAFSRAGHNLQIEQPEQFRSAVAAWFYTEFIKENRY